MRHSLTRIVTCLALLVPNVGWDCKATHVVGTDDGGGSCAGQTAPPCVPPQPGCDWVGPECVNGSLTCGTLTCADAGGVADAGSCAGQTAPPCAPPPAGCTWVGPECVHDTLTCGTLACEDAGAAGGQGNSATCQQSVSAYCASGAASCDPTWAAALSRWCAGIPGAGNALETCNGFDVLLVENVDAPVLEYFDPATGLLVAVLENQAKSGGGVACVAGPSTFDTSETCSIDTTQPACTSPDAGAQDGGGHD